MTDFTVLTMGHPHLRRVASPITTIASPQLQADIATLFDVMTARHGVGIAAPQVDWSVQLFIMASAPNARYPDAPLMAPTVMINPEIIAQSNESNKDWEGCLSVPGLRGLVPRSTSIDVRYTTMEGKQITTHFEGFLARVFQHEWDHLQGILFVDRVESSLDLMVEAEWQRQFLAQDDVD